MNWGEDSASRTQAFILFRWAAMVPAAVIAGFLALSLARGAVWIGFSTMLDTRSWVYSILVEGVGSVALGGAYLYTGVAVSPKRDKLTIFILSGVAIAFSAVVSFLALQQRDFLAIFSAAVALGSTLASASVNLRELESRAA